MKLDTKKCIKCHSVKPVSEYQRYRVGLRRICNSCPVSARGKSQTVHQAEFPCPACGKTYTVMGFASRVKARKYCSHECSRKALRSETHYCRRCGKHRPYEAFDRKNRSRSRKAFCRDCGAIALAGTGTSDRPRPTYDQIYRTVKARVSGEGTGFALKAAEVRRMYRALGCALCGAAIVTLRRIHAGTVDRDNVQGFCRRCRSLLCRHTKEELLAAASEIHAHQVRKGASYAATA